MPDQPEQAPASPTVTAAPAPAVVPKAAAPAKAETVKGRWMVRTPFDDFTMHEIVTGLPKATVDMHRHQLRRMQDEAQPPQEAK